MTEEALKAQLALVRDLRRIALEFITGKGTLAREAALSEQELHCRAYTAAQVHVIAAHQSTKNALSTELAWRAGLRAHELLTLERRGEAQASAHRQWSEDRFLGRAGERYMVTGKGGLRREVMIPADPAARLEARRWETPRVARDRGIVCRQHYNIGGGNAWSKSFSDASTRALGWSHGAHGLRHSYAQERAMRDCAQYRSLNLGFQWRKRRLSVGISPDNPHSGGHAYEVEIVDYH